MFYHVSDKFIGEEVEFIPKVPESAIIEREGNIPRICVSKSILLCLRGKLGIKSIDYEDIVGNFSISKNCIYSPSVYYNDNEEPLLPPRQGDFRRNKEHWFITITKFKHLGYIDTLYYCYNKKIKIIEKYMEFNLTNEQLEYFKNIK